MLLSCSVYVLHPHDMQKSNAEFTISIRLTQALFNNSMHIIIESEFGLLKVQDTF